MFYNKLNYIQPWDIFTDEVMLAGFSRGINVSNFMRMEEIEERVAKLETAPPAAVQVVQAVESKPSYAQFFENNEEEKEDKVENESLREWVNKIVKNLQNAIGKLHTFYRDAGEETKKTMSAMSLRIDDAMKWQMAT